MQVKRTRHTRAFVQISNDIARHQRLSLEAVGLLVRLLSLPDDNGATVDKIVAKVPNGKRSVSKAMNELISEGYVCRLKTQDPETGLWVTLTTVTDAPSAHIPTVGSPTTQSVGRSPKEKDPKGNTPLPAAETSQRPEGRDGSKEGEESPQANTSQETAVSCLGRLGSVEPRLRLTVTEIMRLAPLASQWLAEGFSESKVIKALTRALPVSVDSAAALVSYRLKNHRPEEAQPLPVLAPQVDHRSRCQGCEAVFPAGVEAELCRLCEDEMARAVARITGDPIDLHQESREVSSQGAALVRSQIIRK